MAQRTVLVDDLDGSTENVETVSFAVDGSHYEIDLNQGNAQELRAKLAAYQAVARPSRPYSRTPKKTTPANSRSDVPGGVIRAWAKQKRIRVPAKGRIPADVRERYLAENKPSK